MTVDFDLLEFTLPPSGTIFYALGPISETLRNPCQLEGSLWVVGADFGPVFAEIPAKLAIGKATGPTHVEISISRVNLALVEASGRIFNPMQVPAAQALKQQLVAYIQAALDALVAPPGLRIDSAQHVGSPPALDWPPAFAGYEPATQHAARSRALSEFLDFRSTGVPGREPDAQNLDPRLQRFLDWVEAAPRLTETTLQLWHSRDAKELVVQLTTLTPPGLVTGARVLRDGIAGITIEDMPKSAASNAQSIHALRRLIVLARCFEGVWHGVKPRLTVEITFTDPTGFLGYRLTIAEDFWGMPLARLALGRAHQNEITAVFQTFQEDG